MIIFNIPSETSTFTDDALITDALITLAQLVPGHWGSFVMEDGTVTIFQKFSPYEDKLTNREKLLAYLGDINKLLNYIQISRLTNIDTINDFPIGISELRVIRNTFRTHLLIHQATGASHTCESFIQFMGAVPTLYGTHHRELTLIYNPNHQNQFEVVIHGVTFEHPNELAPFIGALKRHLQTYHATGFTVTEVARFFNQEGPIQSVFGLTMARGAIKQTFSPTESIRDEVDPGTWIKSSPSVVHCRFMTLDIPPCFFTISSNDLGGLTINVSSTRSVSTNTPPAQPLAAASAATPPPYSSLIHTGSVTPTRSAPAMGSRGEQSDLQEKTTILCQLTPNLAEITNTERFSVIESIMRGNYDETLRKISFLGDHKAALSLVKTFLSLPSLNINVDAQGAGSGKTALHRAAEAGNRDLYNYLMRERGANTNIQDKQGRLASSYLPAAAAAAGV